MRRTEFLTVRYWGANGFAVIENRIRGEVRWCKAFDDVIEKIKEYDQPKVRTCGVSERNVQILRNYATVEIVF